MRLYEGTIHAAREGFITVELPTGERLDLKAGADVEAQAERKLGLRVRFQAFLHESTLSLASPIFVIGSQMGLQAVACESARVAEAAE